MSRDVIDELQEDWGRQRPDLDSDAMGVVLRIQALEKVLGDQAAELLRDFGLHWWQYDVLATLRRQGEPFRMTASDLAQASRLSSGAMTNRIDRLERAGLVRRAPDSADGRRVLVQLTERGQDLVERAMTARFEIAAEALSCLRPQQRRQLSDLLRRVLLAQEPDE
jgi:DNA-binding MarR family transcriptional regulator